MVTNANPVVYAKKERRSGSAGAGAGAGASANEVVEAIELFDHIRDIRDPEHDYSLEELNVVSEECIEVDNERSYVTVSFTPTVPHCDFALLIGLCLKVKLMLFLPPRYKVDIRVAPGTHLTEASVNKRLNDKERVEGALYKPEIVNIINRCLASYPSTHDFEDQERRLKTRKVDIGVKRKEDLWRLIR